MKILFKTLLLVIILVLAMSNLTAVRAQDYGDNALDIRDYNTFVSCFRKQVSEVPGCEAADLNDDGIVDSSDFVLLFESFQTQYGD